MTTHSVAVDLGGSSVRAAGPHCPVEQPARLPVWPHDSCEALVKAIASVVEEASDGVQLRHVLVALPSYVMPDGTVGPIPSLPALRGERLDLLLMGAVRTASVTLVPDLSAATIGESRLGAGRGVGRFLCVAIGTGVNAGAVTDDHLVETAFGSFGDAGHVLVDPAGPPCPCGGVGCLEAVCSGLALARAGAGHGYSGARAVIDAALAGEAAAITLLDQAGAALGRAMSTWSVLLWPQVIAVAGGLSIAGDLLLEPARTELQRVGPPYVTEGIRVVQAELGASATLAGAALLAGVAA